MSWFALMVRPQHEKAVREQLTAKALETYVPMIQSRKRWSDRVKSAEMPLFPRYAFCRFSFEDRVAVLRTMGVVRVVGFGGQPTPVRDEEIEAVKTMIGSGRVVTAWPLLRVGQRVRIEDGPLAGLEGVLAREKSVYRVVVNVDLLNRGVAVEVDREEVRPIVCAAPGSADPFGRRAVA